MHCYFTGSAFDSLNIVGPFSTQVQAQDHAMANCVDKRYQVVEMLDADNNFSSGTSGYAVVVGAPANSWRVYGPCSEEQGQDLAGTFAMPFACVVALTNPWDSTPSVKTTWTANHIVLADHTDPALALTIQEFRLDSPHVACFVRSSDLTQIQQVIADGSHEFHLAKDSHGDTYGVIASRTEKDDTVIEFVWVHPTARHSSVGSALLQAVVARAKQQGSQNVKVITEEFYRHNGAIYLNTDLIAFFQDNDFAVVDTEQYRDFTMLIMALHLS